MEQTRPRSQFSVIFAAIASVHGVLIWLLLGNAHIRVMRSGSGSLELMYIPPAAAPASAAPARSPTTSRASSQAEKRIENRGPPKPAVPAAEHPDAGTSPPIDWGAELARAAENSISADSARKFKDFGFPRASAGASPKSAEFGWSHAHIHRVETMAEGGILVNLNDNCVLVFVPLPFVFCAPGKKPANGDLFKHMVPPSVAGEKPE